MSIGSLSEPTLYGSSASEAKSISEKNSTVSMTDFFTLLSAQLQNQTMYDSVDSSEYMNQLVQYTMLSQLQELSSAADTSYAVSLIGRTVSVVNTGLDGRERLISATVDKVAFDSGKPYLLVGGAYYETADVLRVEKGETAPAQEEEGEEESVQ